MTAFVMRKNSTIKGVYLGDEELIANQRKDHLARLDYDENDKSKYKSFNLYLKHNMWTTTKTKIID